MNAKNIRQAQYPILLTHVKKGEIYHVRHGCGNQKKAQKEAQGEAGERNSAYIALRQ